MAVLRATDVPGLLRALMAGDPGRPRLTWYGTGFDRIELSAKTLENWVAKTANLLADELEAGPGTTLGLALPPHWRTVVWALAGWSVGAHVVVGDEADIVATDHPDDATAATVVAVALPGLAVRFAGELPDGAIDAATEVRAQPDLFVPGAPPSPGAPAFSGGGTTLTYGELFPPAAPEATAPRVLTDAGPDDAPRAWLLPLLADGSLVLHDPALPEADVARIAAQENATTP